MKKSLTISDTSSHSMFRKGCALALTMTTAFSPALSSAALFPGLIGRTVTPTLPPPGMLPQLANPNSMVKIKTDGTTMTITQNNGDKVIINWDSFNIGSDAKVRFYQGTGIPGTASWVPNSNYTALNRISGGNPSVINGGLTADGRVYLINRNGVFFGPQGKVQVQTLVASAFDMSDDDFKKGLLRFGDPAGVDQPAADATISNEGEIKTNYGGSVFLIGPKVQNLGTISAPSGKIDLVGLLPNGQVKITEVSPARNADMDVSYTDPSKAVGDVANLSDGVLKSDDGGWIGLYGNRVQNDGVIRAVTSRSKNGIIYLLAREQVTTGTDSLTEVAVSSNNDEKMARSQTFLSGSVTIAGLPGSSPLARIDHEGTITAHSGSVTMEASERVYLGTGSIIDVSGLTIERSMMDQFLEVQLNSLNLRDDYGQKNNTIMQGIKVWVDVSKGSAVGNLSGYYLGMEKNAQDLSTTGGSINIGASTRQSGYSLGDIIISKGAGINLTGGAVTYRGAAPATSRLIGSDGRVYDISTAPQWLTYTGVLGKTVKSYGKYGSKILDGISFGGHFIKLNSKVADRVAGGDAGSLSLRSRVVKGLDDALNLKADVTQGFYQTTTTSGHSGDDYLISINRGLEAPVGGKLALGNELSTNFALGVNINQDAAIQEVRTKNSVTQDNTEISATGAVLDHSTPTEISASMLSRVNLGTLAINANTTITTDNDASITLRPGGSYIARGRRVEFLGSILTPGGSVEMSTQPNITSYVPADSSVNPLYDGTIRETIYLGSSSHISTAGERIDNSRPGLSPLFYRTGGFTSGGSIVLRQLSGADAATVSSSRVNENSVVVSQGAQLDVSGGYLINERGVVSGGNAGSLKVQAHTISLGGDLRGHSLPGKDGGELVLHAQEVQVVAPGQGQQVSAGFGINDQFSNDATFQSGKLVVGADRFKDTGFARINLIANDNLTVASGVLLAPSAAKGDLYKQTTGSSVVCTAGSCVSAAFPNPQDQIGKTSISLSAGTNVYGSNFHDSNDKLNNLENATALLNIARESRVEVADGGKITLAAPLVEIAGSVTARGGDIKASASKGYLLVKGTGQINAKGYIKTALAKADQPAPLPVAKDGGKVILEALAGKLILEANSRVDVSGVDGASGSVRDARGTITTVAVAGDAGSLELSYGLDKILAGAITGAGGNLPGTRNGTLTEKNTTAALTLDATDVSRYQRDGFDALTFSSPDSINVSENLNLSVGRSLTLKSPRIKGSGAKGTVASINAPWLTLAGNSIETATTGAADFGSGAIRLSGTDLDLQGGLLLEGFSTVNLQAARDLTVAESYYKSDSGSDIAQWRGYLKTTAADLTLQANRIYTTTAIDTSPSIARNFTVTSPSNFAITTPGKVTTLSGQAGNQDTTPIYSAGGNLTINADGGIDHRGFLAAPQGSITLDGGATGRVELASGSVLTTAGSVQVAYGAYDGSKWYDKYVSENIKGAEVTAAPAKAIHLNGPDVVVHNGAIQDLSGGGLISAAIWQPGIPGSKNPLTVSGRYVILPDGSATRPGPSVYLDAMPALGLKAGVYSILPVEFAFVPGALVIQDTGKQIFAGQQTLSKEHYPVVAGYRTVRDLPQVASQVRNGFSVRRAEDVLAEGDFSNRRSFANGNGGDFTFTATGDARFDGTLKLASLTGYRHGSASFAAQIVEIVAAVDAAARPGTLQLDGKKISDLNIGVLTLGDSVKTNTVTVEDGVSVTADGVTLVAKDAVTLKDGATVHANDGYASVVTPDGVFTLGDGARLSAQNGGLKLDVTQTSLSAIGTLDAGKDGSFSLMSNNIKFDDAVKDGIPADATENYFHLTQALEDIFNKNIYKSFTIASRGDMVFKRKVNLTSESLTFDAARYLSDTTENVGFSAREITLLNSGSAYDTANPLTATGGTLNFTADNITVAPRQDGTKGNIAFDKFGTVNVNSKNDLVFKGVGTVATGGNLNLNAARVTTVADRYKADGSYTPATITVDGRSGAVTLNGSQSDGTAGISSTPGGSLQILGKSITQNGGILDVTAGQIVLTAASDIVINSTVKATGSEQVTASGDKVYYSGGKITMQSDNGTVDLQSGAVLDVSAAVVTDNIGKIVTDTNGAAVRKGDAGSMLLSAKTGGVKKAATAQLEGQAGTGGKGGSFSIDSATLVGVNGLNGLSTTLANGGFNDLINIRSRGTDLTAPENNNLTLSGGNTITGREVVIAADKGSITITGVMAKNDKGVDVASGGITVDTNDGNGRIELYADKSLTIGDKATLSAKGTDSGSHGGYVMLSTQDGSDNSKTFNGIYALNVNSGSTIDVAGNGGAGGTVHFRAYQGKKDSSATGLNEVNMAAVTGSITSADRVEVEAVRSYANKTTVGNLTTNIKDATDFMAAAIPAKVSGSHLQAGVEISSAVDTNLTVDQALNLKDVRPGGEAVVLTLKSKKDLLVNQSITDAPTTLGALHSSTMAKNTTAINLVAGSDGGANYLGTANGSALTAGSGDLTIANGKWIYSENAPIRFAAGNDAIFKGTSSGPATMINADMKYNLGSYDGTVRGDVGRDLNLTATGSAIQTAMGNITIRTGRDINLGAAANTGAIRTTGEYNPGITGKTEIAPGLNEFLALPELAGLLNPAYNPAIKNVTDPRSNPVNPAYRNLFNLDKNVLQDLAVLIYNNGGSSNGAASVPVSAASYWTYHNGGSISLDTGRSVVGNLNAANGWDEAYIDSKYFTKAPKFSDNLVPWYLTAAFGGSKEKIKDSTYTTSNIPVTVGVATMAGGDVTVTAGGSLLTQVGAFGAGDVTVTTGADLGGRFRTMNGATTLTSGGGFGAPDKPVVNELGDAQARVVAMGDVHLGTVQNPDNTRDHIFFGLKNQKLWNMTYGTASGFSAASLAGSAILYGTNPYYGYSAYSGNAQLQGLDFRKTILPTSFALAAAGDLEIRNQFVLAPSSDGNLELSAGGNIRGEKGGNGDLKSGFIMQDVELTAMYGRQSETANGHYEKLSGDAHAGINHFGDSTEVKVAAGKDLDTLILKLNKPADVSAGGDINELKFIGQNLTPDSMSTIKAGGSIDQGITIDPRDPVYGTLMAKTPTMELGGPGTLLVQAGNSIRLGNSGGINSVGNINNNGFGGSGKETDSDLIVAAGADSGISLTKPAVEQLFAEISSASDRIPKLKADGKSGEADVLLSETEKSIRKFYYTYNKNIKAGTGDLDLVDSAISTRTGDIYAMAGSNINVGKTALSNTPLTTSGVTTLFGGRLSVYAGGDINVNESRLMTYYGGDISVWSDQGNINAGRGSKTIVSAPTPVYNFDANGVLLSVSYTPPSAGSGIRALTFDVDGSGPGLAPEQGKVFIHAPGVVDGGEAGIVGSTIGIDAGKVLNSQNIVASVGSIGVPSSSQNTVSIGPMTGATDMTNDKKLIETISGGGGEAAKKTALAQAEDFLMKYLDIKVIDLSEGTL